MKVEETVKETYYEILGIEENATEDDIRKAYRRQALLWHPDKNANRREEAEAKFKLIAEAYEVLSDAEKRRTYDLYGKEGLKNGGPAFETRTGPFPHFQFHDPNEIFRRFFGNDPFSDSFFSDPFGFGMPRPQFFGGSMFSEPMFGQSMSSTTFLSSSSSFGGNGGYKKTTTTQIVDGVRTTVTRIEDADGNISEETIRSQDTGNLRMNNMQHHFIQDNYNTRRNIPIQDGNMYYSPVTMQQPGYNIQYEGESRDQQQHYESQQELPHRRMSGGTSSSNNR
ncbi:5381_t:CDS:2, partial [Acaulospora morrowiae]